MAENFEVKHKKKGTGYFSQLSSDPEQPSAKTCDGLYARVDEAKLKGFSKYCSTVPGFSMLNEV
ncbi:hypothetical protein BGX27_006020 [Mortierella sp. AM989]|nr:hypothetical protein BGX27_006020 [Mortierella sp. AM989]